MAFHKHVRWIYVELTWVRPGRIQVPSRVSGAAWVIESNLPETPKTWCFGVHSPLFEPEQIEVDESGVGTCAGKVLREFDGKFIGTFTGKVTKFLSHDWIVRNT